MKRIMLIAMVLTAGLPWVAVWAKQGTPEPPGNEKEFFIDVTSGLKTLPIRKTISIIINKADARGITAIKGSGRHLGQGVWDLNLNFIGGPKAERTLKWSYNQERWDLRPLNEEAQAFSFPLDSYIFGPAINMGINLIKEKEVPAEDINGLAEKLPNGQWQLSLTSLSDKDEHFTQRWLSDSKASRLYPAHFDHTELDKLLESCVRKGRVNYTVVRGNPHLKNFLKKIGDIKEEELNSLSREEQMAFWINAYNAIILQLVVEKYPVDSIKSITGAMDKKKVKAAGKKITLEEIRDGILRGVFKDKRIIFALASATSSSPALRAEAYCGRHLEKQLEEGVSDFVNAPDHLSVTPKERTLYLSMLFDWFGEDFSSGDSGKDFSQYGSRYAPVLRYISAYLPEEECSLIRDNKFEVKFLAYDWGLNDWK